MIMTYGLRKYLANHPELKAMPVQDGMNYEVGGTYYCGYWDQAYRVLSLQHDVPIWYTTVTVLWEDGRTTTHSTSLESKWDAKLVNTSERV